MKKLLVLGGKPIGSCELVQRAKELGYYVIVTDFLESSPAKLLANEVWNISTANIQMLYDKCIAENIDGILTAVHEFNINRMIDLCELLDKPCYCSRETWKYCDSKLEFKNLCLKNNIRVAKQYKYDEVLSYKQNSLFPTLVTKPIDGSGSRGFSICHNWEEFMHGYQHAIDFSPSKQVLIEDYIPFDTVIIHYTMIHGKCFFSGMSDKYSAQFVSTGASVMGLQMFPSKGKDIYMQTLNKQVCTMFERAGFKEGPIWIEAFYDGKGSFIFNEMGYRFGGSLTYYPVKYFYNISQLDLLIESAFVQQSDFVMKLQVEEYSKRQKYCILPVHLHPGIIRKISGIVEIQKYENLYSLVPVHFIGDEIKEWGSAQQVFCYLHILYNTSKELKNSIDYILQNISVEDSDGKSMLYTLFNLDNLL